ncbi:glycoside hydrolase family 5 protein [Vibrio sp. SM6]|uniref:Glycoside hydrolase family 5 protein n=1 Tax=Vibrio agarilyticus TaxID=2726741 RepID=A0A7X8YGG3_9VIBR|nr:cellulase family glycosylhydrolase [Vibrio agarilyticus]NLS12520.1 glycoside hydrolase family 5 protein [Vibrio agarilyticus]
MKKFKLSLLAAATTLVLGCDAGYYNETPTPEKGPGENNPNPDLELGTGKALNFIIGADGAIHFAEAPNDGEERFYINGTNVAWLNFANDFGKGFDYTKAEAMMNGVAAAGGNTLRWWIHTNGTTTPMWDGSTVAAADKQEKAIDEIATALDLAEKKNLKVIFSLWSFDMLAKTTETGVADVIDNNFALLTDNAVRQTYIDNFLTPLVNKIKDKPALLALEVFNEPENMTEPWFREREALASSEYPVTVADIYATTAELTAAIHMAASDMLVTTGPKSLGQFVNESGSGNNAYSDSNMEAALPSDYTDKALAHLDFYAPHYYDDMGKEGAWSPFYHDVSYWELDKPVVLGEFYADATADKPADYDYFDDPLKGSQVCYRLVKANYAGGMSWQFAGNSGKYQQSAIDCMKAANEALGNSDVEDPTDPEGEGIGFEDGNIEGFKAFLDSTEGTILPLEVSNDDARSGEKSAIIKATSVEGEKKILLQLPFDEETVLNEVKMYVKFSPEAKAAGVTGGKIYAKDSDWKFIPGDWESIDTEDENGWVEFTWISDSPLIGLKDLAFEAYGANNGLSFSGNILFDDIIIK